MAGPCSTVLPPVSADLCDLNSFFGEINQIYFTRWGDDFTDWEDPDEWTARLDQDDALAAPGTDAKIRTLYGIGSIEPPERNTIAASRRRVISTTPKYTLPFRVEDTSDTNIEFARTLPVGGQQYAVWFGTEERLFGGNTGVLATMTADPTIPESIDDIMRILVNMTFSGTFPEVTDNFLS